MSKSNKKLCFIRANKTKFGGAENYLSRLSVELQNQKVSYTSIHSNIPVFFASWIRALLFNFQVCTKKSKEDFYFSLERITCPDIYRAGDGVHKVFMDIEKKSKFNPLNITYLYIEKKMFQNAKKIIAISNMVKNDIIKTYNIAEDKITVIYNGIKLQPYNFDKAFTRLSQEFNLQKEEKILLYVGSGYKRKGVKEFLEILAQIKNRNFKAFIIGKEKNISYYKDLAHSLHINNNVIFTGARNDVNDFYTISDIFLFPTHYEPFGNVILEAMNFYNAVITTTYCGGGEILDSSFVMQTPQDFSIVKTIDNLLENAQKLKEIKQRNYEIVQNFTIEKNAIATLEVINEYLY